MNSNLQTRDKINDLLVLLHKLDPAGSKHIELGFMRQLEIFKFNTETCSYADIAAGRASSPCRFAITEINSIAPITADSNKMIKLKDDHQLETITTVTGRRMSRLDQYNSQIGQLPAIIVEDEKQEEAMVHNTSILTGNIDYVHPNQTVKQSSPEPTSQKSLSFESRRSRSKSPFQIHKRQTSDTLVTEEKEQGGSDTKQAYTPSKLQYSNVKSKFLKEDSKQTRSISPRKRSDKGIRPMDLNDLSSINRTLTNVLSTEMARCRSKSPVWIPGETASYSDVVKGNSRCNSRIPSLEDLTQVNSGAFESDFDTKTKNETIYSRNNVEMEKTKLPKLEDGSANLILQEVSDTVNSDNKNMPIEISEHKHSLGKLEFIGSEDEKFAICSPNMAKGTFEKPDNKTTKAKREQNVFKENESFDKEDNLTKQISHLPVFYKIEDHLENRNKIEVPYDTAEKVISKQITSKSSKFEVTNKQFMGFNPHYLPISSKKDEQFSNLKEKAYLGTFDSHKMIDKERSRSPVIKKNKTGRLLSPSLIGNKEIYGKNLLAITTRTRSKSPVWTPGLSASYSEVVKGNSRVPSLGDLTDIDKAIESYEFKSDNIKYSPSNYGDEDIKKTNQSLISLNTSSLDYPSESKLISESMVDNLIDTEIQDNINQTSVNNSIVSAVDNLISSSAEQIIEHSDFGDDNTSPDMEASIQISNEQEMLENKIMKPKTHESIAKDKNETLSAINANLVTPCLFQDKINDPNTGSKRKKKKSGKKNNLSDDSSNIREKNEVVSTSKAVSKSPPRSRETLKEDNSSHDKTEWKYSKIYPATSKVVSIDDLNISCDVGSLSTEISDINICSPSISDNSNMLTDVKNAETSIKDKRKKKLKKTSLVGSDGRDKFMSTPDIIKTTVYQEKPGNYHSLQIPSFSKKESEPKSIVSLSTSTETSIDNMGIVSAAINIKNKTNELELGKENDTFKGKNKNKPKQKSEHTSTTIIKSPSFGHTEKPSNDNFNAIPNVSSMQTGTKTLPGQDKETDNNKIKGKRKKKPKNKIESVDEGAEGTSKGLLPSTLIIKSTEQQKYPEPFPVISFTEKEKEPTNIKLSVTNPETAPIYIIDTVPEVVSLQSDKKGIQTSSDIDKKNYNSETIGDDPCIFSEVSNYENTDTTLKGKIKNKQKNEEGSADDVLEDTSSKALTFTNLIRSIEKQEDINKFDQNRKKDNIISLHSIDCLPNNQMGESSSYSTVTVFQPIERQVHMFKKTVRQVVIIDGKEHVSETVVEVPEHVISSPLQEDVIDSFAGSSNSVSLEETDGSRQFVVQSKKTIRKTVKMANGKVIHEETEIFPEGLNVVSIGDPSISIVEVQEEKDGFNYGTIPQNDEKSINTASNKDKKTDNTEIASKERRKKKPKRKGESVNDIVKDSTSKKPNTESVSLKQDIRSSPESVHIGGDKNIGLVTDNVLSGIQECSQPIFHTEPSSKTDDQMVFLGPSTAVIGTLLDTQQGETCSHSSKTQDCMTKKTIRKVVIINGKEHVTETVVEEPEQVISSTLQDDQIPLVDSFANASKSFRLSKIDESRQVVVQSKKKRIKTVKMINGKVVHEETETLPEEVDIISIQEPSVSYVEFNKEKSDSNENIPKYTPNAENILFLEHEASPEITLETTNTPRKKTGEQIPHASEVISLVSPQLNLEAINVKNIPSVLSPDHSEEFSSSITMHKSPQNINIKEEIIQTESDNIGLIYSEFYIDTVNEKTVPKDISFSSETKLQKKIIKKKKDKQKNPSQNRNPSLISDKTSLQTVIITTSNKDKETDGNAIVGNPSLSTGSDKNQEISLKGKKEKNPKNKCDSVGINTSKASLVPSPEILEIAGKSSDYETMPITHPIKMEKEPRTGTLSAKVVSLQSDIKANDDENTATKLKNKRKKKQKNKGDSVDDVITDTTSKNVFTSAPAIITSIEKSDNIEKVHIASSTKTGIEAISGISSGTTFTNTEKVPEFVSLQQNTDVIPTVSDKKTDNISIIEYDLSREKDDENTETKLKGKKKKKPKSRGDSVYNINTDTTSKAVLTSIPAIIESIGQADDIENVPSASSITTEIEPISGISSETTTETKYTDIREEPEFVSLRKDTDIIHAVSDQDKKTDSIQFVKNDLSKEKNDENTETKLKGKKKRKPKSKGDSVGDINTDTTSKAVLTSIPAIIGLIVPADDIENVPSASITTTEIEPISGISCVTTTETTFTDIEKVPEFVSLQKNTDVIHTVSDQDKKTDSIQIVKNDLSREKNDESTVIELKGKKKKKPKSRGDSVDDINTGNTSEAVLTSIESVGSADIIEKVHSASSTIETAPLSDILTVTTTETTSSDTQTVPELVFVQPSINVFRTVSNQENDNISIIEDDLSREKNDENAETKLKGKKKKKPKSKGDSVENKYTDTTSKAVLTSIPAIIESIGSADNVEIVHSASSTTTEISPLSDILTVTTTETTSSDTQTVPELVFVQPSINVFRTVSNQENDNISIIEDDLSREKNDENAETKLKGKKKKKPKSKGDSVENKYTDTTSKAVLTSIPAIIESIGSADNVEIVHSASSTTTEISLISGISSLTTTETKYTDIGEEPEFVSLQKNTDVIPTVSDQDRKTDNISIIEDDLSRERIDENTETKVKGKKKKKPKSKGDSVYSINTDTTSKAVLTSIPAIVESIRSADNIENVPVASSTTTEISPISGISSVTTTKTKYTDIREEPEFVSLRKDTDIIPTVSDQDKKTNSIQIVKDDLSRDKIDETTDSKLKIKMKKKPKNKGDPVDDIIIDTTSKAVLTSIPAIIGLIVPADDIENVPSASFTTTEIEPIRGISCVTTTETTFTDIEKVPELVFVQQNTNVIPTVTNQDKKTDSIQIVKDDLKREKNDENTETKLNRNNKNKPKNRCDSVDDINTDNTSEAVLTSIESAGSADNVEKVHSASSIMTETAPPSDILTVTTTETKYTDIKEEPEFVSLRKDTDVIPTVSDQDKKTSSIQIVKDDLSKDKIDETTDSKLKRKKKKKPKSKGDSVDNIITDVTSNAVLTSIPAIIECIGPADDIENVPSASSTTTEIESISGISCVTTTETKYTDNTEEPEFVLVQQNTDFIPTVSNQDKKTDNIQIAIDDLSREKNDENTETKLKGKRKKNPKQNVHFVDDIIEGTNSGKEHTTESFMKQPEAVSSTLQLDQISLVDSTEASGSSRPSKINESFFQAANTFPDVVDVGSIEDPEIGIVEIREGKVDPNEDIIERPFSQLLGDIIRICDNITKPIAEEDKNIVFETDDVRVIDDNSLELYEVGQSIFHPEPTTEFNNKMVLSVFPTSRTDIASETQHGSTSLDNNTIFNQPMIHQVLAPKRTIRKIVIVDGEEHVTETTVEEPEQVISSSLQDNLIPVINSFPDVSNSFSSRKIDESRQVVRKRKQVTKTIKMIHGKVVQEKTKSFHEEVDIGSIEEPSISIVEVAEEKVDSIGKILEKPDDSETLHIAFSTTSETEPKSTILPPSIDEATLTDELHTVSNVESLLPDVKHMITVSDQNIETDNTATIDDASCLPSKITNYKTTLNTKKKNKQKKKGDLMDILIVEGTTSIGVDASTPITDKKTDDSEILPIVSANKTKTEPKNILAASIVETPTIDDIHSIPDVTLLQPDIEDVILSEQNKETHKTSTVGGDSCLCSENSNYKNTETTLKGKRKMKGNSMDDLAKVMDDFFSKTYIKSTEKADGDHTLSITSSSKKEMIPIDDINIIPVGILHQPGAKCVNTSFDDVMDAKIIGDQLDASMKTQLRDYSMISSIATADALSKETTKTQHDNARVTEALNIVQDPIESSQDIIENNSQRKKKTSKKVKFPTDERLIQEHYPTHIFGEPSPDDLETETAYSDQIKYCEDLLEENENSDICIHSDTDWSLNLSSTPEGVTRQSLFEIPSYSVDMKNEQDKFMTLESKIINLNDNPFDWKETDKSDNIIEPPINFSVCKPFTTHADTLLSQPDLSSDIIAPIELTDPSFSCYETGAHEIDLLKSADITKSFQELSDSCEWQQVSAVISNIQDSPGDSSQSNIILQHGTFKMIKSDKDTSSVSRWVLPANEAQVNVKKQSRETSPSISYQLKNLPISSSLKHNEILVEVASHKPLSFKDEPSTDNLSDSQSLIERDDLQDPLSHDSHTYEIETSTEDKNDPGRVFESDIYLQNQSLEIKYIRNDSQIDNIGKVGGEESFLFNPIAYDKITKRVRESSPTKALMNPAYESMVAHNDPPREPFPGTGAISTPNEGSLLCLPASQELHSCLQKEIMSPKETLLEETFEEVKEVLNSVALPNLEESDKKFEAKEELVEPEIIPISLKKIEEGENLDKVPPSQDKYIQIKQDEIFEISSDKAGLLFEKIEPIPKTENVEKSVLKDENIEFIKHEQTQTEFKPKFKEEVVIKPDNPDVKDKVQVKEREPKVLLKNESLPEYKLPTITPLASTETISSQDDYTIDNLEVNIGIGSSQSGSSFDNTVELVAEIAISTSDKPSQSQEEETLGTVNIHETVRKEVGPSESKNISVSANESKDNDVIEQISDVPPPVKARKKRKLTKETNVIVSSPEKTISEVMETNFVTPVTQLVSLKHDIVNTPEISHIDEDKNINLDEENARIMVSDSAKICEPSQPVLYAEPSTEIDNQMILSIPSTGVTETISNTQQRESFSHSTLTVFQPIVQQVRLTKKTIRKVVIINGKEHVTETLAEEPEQVISSTLQEDQTPMMDSFTSVSDSFKVSEINTSKQVVVQSRKKTTKIIKMINGKVVHEETDTSPEELNVVSIEEPDEEKDYGNEKITEDPYVQLPEDIELCEDITKPSAEKFLISELECPQQVTDISREKMAMVPPSTCDAFSQVSPQMTFEESSIENIVSVSGDQPEESPSSDTVRKLPENANIKEKIIPSKSLSVGSDSSDCYYPDIQVKLTVPKEISLSVDIKPPPKDIKKSKKSKKKTNKNSNICDSGIVDSTNLKNVTPIEEKEITFSHKDEYHNKIFDNSKDLTGQFLESEISNYDEQPKKTEELDVVKCEIESIYPENEKHNIKDASYSASADTGSGPDEFKKEEKQNDALFTAGNITLSKPDKQSTISSFEIDIIESGASENYPENLVETIHSKAIPSQFIGKEPVIANIVSDPNSELIEGTNKIKCDEEKIVTTKSQDRLSENVTKEVMPDTLIKEPTESLDKNCVPIAELPFRQIENSGSIKDDVTVTLTENVIYTNPKLNISGDNSLFEGAKIETESKPKEVILVTDKSRAIEILPSVQYLPKETVIVTELLPGQGDDHSVIVQKSKKEKKTRKEPKIIKQAQGSSVKNSNTPVKIISAEALQDHPQSVIKSSNKESVPSLLNDKANQHSSTEKIREKQTKSKSKKSKKDNKVTSKEKEINSSSSSADSSQISPKLSSSFNIEINKDKLFKFERDNTPEIIESKKAHEDIENISRDRNEINAPVMLNVHESKPQNLASDQNEPNYNVEVTTSVEIDQGKPVINVVKSPLTDISTSFIVHESIVSVSVKTDNDEKVESAKGIIEISKDLSTHSDSADISYDLPDSKAGNGSSKDSHKLYDAKVKTSLKEPGASIISKRPDLDLSMSNKDISGDLLQTIKERTLNINTPSFVGLLSDLDNTSKRKEINYNLDLLRHSGEEEKESVVVTTIILISEYLETITYIIINSKKYDRDVTSLEDKQQQISHLLSDLNVLKEDIKCLKANGGNEQLLSALETQAASVKNILGATGANVSTKAAERKELLNRANHLLSLVQNLNEEIEGLEKDQSISAEKKLNKLDKLEITNADYEAQVSLMLKQYPAQPDLTTSSHLLYVNEELLNGLRVTLIQSQALAQEYRDMLVELENVSEVAKTIVASRVIVPSLHDLQNEMQKERKFFISLSHCRAILESLESSLDDETRTATADMYIRLHSTASEVLESAGERAVALALGASRWTLLEQGLAEERGWLRVAQERVPNLSGVSTADHHQYLSLYQSLISDIELHAARVWKLLETAHTLQGLISCNGLEESCDALKTTVGHLEDQVSENVKKLSEFKDIWNGYESLFYRLNRWLDDVTANYNPPLDIQAYWELKAEYEVQKSTYSDICSRYKNAMNILPVTDKGKQALNLKELSDKWDIVSKRLDEVEVSIPSHLSSGERLDIIEARLKQMEASLNSYQDMSNEEALNLYIGKLQVLKEEAVNIENELLCFGLGPASERRKLASLQGRARLLKTQASTEHVAAVSLKERFVALRNGMIRVTRTQAKALKVLDQWEPTVDAGEDIVRQALDNVKEVVKSLCDERVELSWIRETVSRLPVNLRAKLSLAGLEKEIAVLSESHISLSNRAEDLLALILTRLKLWENYGVKLETVRGTVREADYMMELLRIDVGPIDLPRIVKASSRLQGVQESLNEREGGLADLRQASSSLETVVRAEVGERLRSEVREEEAAWARAEAGLGELAGRYQRAAKLWAQYRQAVAAADFPSVIESLSIQEWEKKREAVKQVQLLAEKIAEETGVAGILSSEVNLLARKLEDAKDIITLPSVEPAEQLRTQLIEAIQQKLNRVPEGSTTERLVSLRNSLIDLGKTEGQLTSISSSSPSEDISLNDLLQLWEKAFRGTFQDYHQVLSQLAKTEDFSTIINLWKDYLLHVNHFLESEIPQHYHELHEHNHLCQVHYTVLSSQKSLLPTESSALDQNTVQQLNLLTNMHNEALAKIMDKQKETEARILLWEQYRLNQSNLLDWLKKMERERNQLKLRYIHSQTVGKTILKIEELLMRISEGESMEMTLKEQLITIIPLCDESVASSLQIEHTSLGHRLSNLHAALLTWKDYLEKVRNNIIIYEKHVENVENSFGKIQNILEKENKFTVEKEDRKYLENKLQAVLTVSNHVKDLSEELKSVEDAQDILKDVLSPADLKSMSQKSWLFSQQQNEFEHQLAIAEHIIHDKLQLSEVYEHRLLKFLTWLSSMNNKLSTLPRDAASAMSIIEREIRAEVALKRSEADWLATTGREIGNTASSKEVTEKWTSFQESLSNTTEKLSGISMGIPKLAEEMDDLRIWLHQMETKLSEPIILTQASKKFIASKIKDHKNIQDEIGKQSSKIKDVLNFCEKLLNDCESCHITLDVEAITLAMANLENRWKEICANFSKRKLSLENLSPALEKAQKLAKEQKSWLSELEKQIENHEKQLKGSLLVALPELEENITKLVTDLNSGNSGGLNELDSMYLSLHCEYKLPEEVLKVPENLLNKWEELKSRADELSADVRSKGTDREQWTRSAAKAVSSMAKVDALLTLAEVQESKEIEEIDKALLNECEILREADIHGLKVMRWCCDEDVTKVQATIDEYQSLWRDINERLNKMKVSLEKKSKKTVMQFEDQSVEVNTLKFETDRSTQVDTLGWSPPLARKGAFYEELIKTTEVLETLLLKLSDLSHLETQAEITKCVGECESNYELAKHLSETLITQCSASQEEALVERLKFLGERFNSLRSCALTKQNQLRETSARGRLTCPLCSNKNWQQLDNDLWRLEQWLQYAEGSLSSQPSSPPSSIEQLEDVIQDQRELLLDLDSHRSLVVSMNIVGTHLAEHSEDEARAKELRNRLTSTNKQWELVCELATAWQAKLQTALMQNEEFHDTMTELSEWLEKTETSIRQAEPIDLTDPAHIIEAKNNRFKELQEEVERCEARVRSLEEAARQVLSEEDRAVERIARLRIRLISLSRLIASYINTLSATLGHHPPSDLSSLNLLSQQLLDNTTLGNEQPTSGDEVDTSTLLRCHRFLGRVMRASLPISAFLLLLLGAASFVPVAEQDFACANSFVHNMALTLRYPNGRPPI